VDLVRFAAAACALFLCASALAAPLRSPWDALPIPATPRSWACPPVAPLPRDIAAYDYYSDARKSIPDPARLHGYQQAASPFDRTMNAAERAADFYLKTGSRAAAACVLQILDANARNRAMTGAMASNQSYYVQGWTLGALAVTYLKVRNSAAGPASEQEEIVRWLVRVACATQDYFDQRRAKHAEAGRNNHLYWAGFAVMSAGIAADNRGLYNWGIGTFRDGVGQITRDGTLPLELARGRRALHYHLFAAEPLVTMAELGEANGQDLYAYHRGALHRLVRRCVAGLENNAWFAQQTGFPQDTPGPRLTASDLAWMRPYAQRFRDPAIAALLREVHSLSLIYLGGEPPTVTHADTRADTAVDTPPAAPEPLSTR
jgi:poly(beta-D-mannuronate) lyase